MLNNAVIIGRAHRLANQNCHDAVFTGSPGPGIAFGIVLDGCGSKYRKDGLVSRSHNEVGARLLGQFVAAFLQRQLAPNNQKQAGSAQLQSLLDDLHRASLTYLELLLGALPFDSAAEQARFVATHLLCTLVGFVMTPSDAAFFWSGDGYLGTGKEIVPLDSHNQPDYLAYQLLAGHRPVAENQTGFQRMKIGDPSDVEWLAVATDGWSLDLMAELKTVRPGLELQRWVNVQARKRSTFDDDGAVAVWQRPKGRPATVEPHEQWQTEDAPAQELP